MGTINNNKPMLDRPVWEQLSFAPVAGIAGSNIVSDNERYIYYYIQTSATAVQFWRYCTWYDTFQQLATPPTQTGTVASMVYTKAIGGQFSGKVRGAIYLFVGNGSVAYFYKYDEATNAWSTNLGTTGIPATFATDCSLVYPSVPDNNYENNYHAGVTRTITASVVANISDTSISVNALPEAMPIGTVLRFGTYDITVTSAVNKGATSIEVTGAIQPMKAGTILSLYNGSEVCLSADSVANATTLSVQPLQIGIQANSLIIVEQLAVLTVAVALNATSITVAPLMVAIENSSTAGYYGNMYLVGNNATAMYRYNLGGNAWATTSANSGNPTIPVALGAIGLGGAIKWLSAYSPDALWCLRGGGNSNVYMYNLISNSWTAEIYHPTTETFTTGTMVATRSIKDKQASMLIQKDVTMRIYEGVPYRNTLIPKINQWLYPTSTAVVGNKSCVITSPDGIEFYYIILHSSTAFVRCALIDS